MALTPTTTREPPRFDIEVLCRRCAISSGAATEDALTLTGPDPLLVHHLDRVTTIDVGRA